MSSGGSELSPSSMGDFFGGTGNILGESGGPGGLGTYDKLASQFGGGGSPFFSGISDLGGYQKDMGNIISGNQGNLKDLISGNGGTDWAKVAKGIGQLGKGMSGGPQAGTSAGGGAPLQLGGMNINMGATPPRMGAGTAPQLPAMPMIDLLKAVNVIQSRMRGEVGA